VTRRCLLLLLALGACRKNVLAAALEERLAAAGITATVHCDKTRCTATDDTGKKFTLDATVTDGRLVDWRPRAATIVDTRQLSRDISAQRRGWAAVGCERDTMVVLADESITCVLFDRAPRLLAVTATGDPAHPLRWGKPR